MKKKLLILILTLAMLLSSVPMALPIVAETDPLAEALLAHWDFEGNTPYADKATGGSATDNLQVGSGNGISVADGVLTLGSGVDNYLYAADSKDLLRTKDSRSVYIRFRTDTVDQLAELMNQNSALRLFHGVSANELAATTTPDSMGTNGVWGGKNQDAAFTFDADTWYTLAVCYEKNGTSVGVTMFLSEEGGNLITATSSYTIETGYWSTDSSAGIANAKSGKDSLYIGRRYDGGGQNISKLEIEDVRIYGKALTEAEFTSIQPVTQLEYEGHSLTLDGSIGLNFFLRPHSAFQKENAVVTITNGTQELVRASFDEAHKAAELPVGAYKFTAPIAAKEMTDAMTLTVTSGGVTVYSESYSVKNYADAMLANSAQYDLTTLNLVRSMLQYGAYAQTYFGYKTNALANAGIVQTLPTVNRDTVSYQAKQNGSVSGIASVDATLKLESALQVVFTVKLASGANASDYTFEGGAVTVAGNTVTVITNGIRVQNLDVRQILTVQKGSERMTISYAPMTYLMNELENPNMKLVSLLRSLYGYHTAAQGYVALPVHNYGIVNYTAGNGLLYNGIKLPTTWPPRDVNPYSEEVVVPMYLKSQAEGGYRPEVIDITVGRQLFVDNFLIESTDLTTVYHQATKYEGNPIMTPNAAELQNWNIGTSAGGVWYDMQDQKYKMWYDIGFNDRLGYAESDDGINWTRVNVDGTGSNVVLTNADKNGTCSVIIDYEATDPNERYKMLVQSFNNHCYNLDNNGNVTKDTGADALPGDVDQNSYLHTLFVSADGLHWVQKGGTSIGRSGDMTSMFYNGFTHKWVNSLRGYIEDRTSDISPNERARWYAEHDDFEDLLNWTSEDAVFWLKTDKNDAKAQWSLTSQWDAQQYNFNAIAYESIMLGTYTIWYGPENHVVESEKTPKRNEIQMAYSRDGFYYDRPDRTSFIAVGADGEWDKGYLFGSIGGIIVKEDVLYIYYSGFSGYRYETANGHATQSIGLATLRRDGFASLEGTGTVTTRTLTTNGNKKYLFVNVNTPAASFRAEVLDANGNVIPGFEMENCNAVGGDDTCLQVTWKNGKDLSSLNGTEFKLRFSMNGGEFYSFWLSDSTVGGSGGAVGAGYAG